jgi:rhodanese-related sulfurtransferase
MNTCEFKNTMNNPHFAGVKDIEAQDLVSCLEKVELVDVRQPDEFIGELGHVIGAKLIVLDELPDKIGQVSKDKPIVFICRSGGRSARATAFALSLGFKEVYNLKGGMIHWNELGYQTSKV